MSCAHVVMDVLTEWQKNPVTVTVWNPIARTGVRYVFGQGTPPAQDKHTHETRHVRDVDVWPEDDFMGLRRAIALACGIPIYRQHLYATDDDWTPYALWTSEEIRTRIDDLPRDTISVRGIPVDPRLIKNRDQLRIYANDTFVLVGHRSSRHYRVVDLALWTKPVHAQLQAIAKDKYLFEQIYWGFVVKYWPQLSTEAFGLYIADEHGMSAAYPRLAPSMHDMRVRSASERTLTLARYRNSARARAAISSGFAITQFTASVQSTSVKLNIRNIFEQTRVSATMPEIRAYLNVDGERIMVQRRYVGAPDMDFPAAELFRSGITYAIVLQTGRILWVSVHPSGRYYMRCTFREDDAIGFGDIYGILREHVGDLIRNINAMGRIAFAFGSALELLREHVISYSGLNVAWFWHHTMTTSAFKRIRDSFSEHVTSGAMSIKNVTAHEVTAVWRRGIYDHDSEQIDHMITMIGNIDKQNKYAYLTNPIVHGKWVQNYDGRTLAIIMRDTDLRIDVSAIREDEFATFTDYIRVHLYSLMQDSAFVKLFTRNREHASERRLRRLREHDPALYNMGRYGSDRNYSKICQGVRQPMIYDASALKQLSARERNALTKYWNFTHNTDAYYGCPDPNYTHLGFVVGVHPNGWCLPCCNKRLKQGPSHAKCLHARADGVASDSDSRHLLVYGKEIPLTRMSQVHSDHKPLLPADTYLIGTPPQSAHPQYNIIYAAAQALGLDPRALIEQLAAAFTDAFYESVIDLLGGTDASTCVRLIRDSPRPTGHDDIAWTEVITRLLYNLYACGCIIIQDHGTGSESEDGGNFIVEVPQVCIDLTPTTYLLLMRTARGHVYPFATADPESGDIHESVHPCTQRIIADVLVRARADIARTFGVDTVAGLLTGGDTIVGKYINLRSMCYALEISTRDGPVFISCEYTAIPQVVRRCPRDDAQNRTVGPEVRSDVVGVGPPAAAYAFAQRYNLEITGREHPAGSTYDMIVLENGHRMYVAATVTGGDLDDLEIDMSAFDDDFEDTLVTTRESVATPPAHVDDLDDPFSDIAHTIAGGRDPLVMRKHRAHGPSTAPTGVKAPFAGDRGVVTSANKTETPANTSRTPANESVRVLAWDPRAVNTAILRRAQPPPTERSAELYRMTVYNLLVMSLGEIFDRGRDDDMRKRILALAPSRMHELRPELSALDYYVILSTIHYAGMKGLRTKLEYEFDFDRVALRQIQQMSRADAVREIRRLLSDIVVEVVDPIPLDSEAFPNLYTVCTRGPSQPFCDGPKLRVHNLDQYIDVIADDLRNPLLADVMFGELWANAIVDRLRFAAHSDDKITVYKLA